MKVREAVYLPVAVAMLALASAACAQAGGANPDVLEVRHYALTLDKAQKAATAMQGINQLAAANPSLNAALNAGSSTTGKKPMTQQAHDIDSQFAQIASIIHSSGLTTREFIVVTAAIINDMGFVSLKKSGTIQAYPPGMITTENAELIEGNWDAFQAIVARMTPPDEK